MWGCVPWPVFTTASGWHHVPHWVWASCQCAGVWKSERWVVCCPAVESRADAGNPGSCITLCTALPQPEWCFESPMVAPQGLAHCMGKPAGAAAAAHPHMHRLLQQRPWRQSRPPMATVQQLLPPATATVVARAIATAATATVPAHQTSRSSCRQQRQQQLLLQRPPQQQHSATARLQQQQHQVLSACG